LELKRRTSSPQGLYGSARASALSAIDRRHYSDAVIVADLSNDATYAEVLHETFGPRVIGLQISRNCDGMNVERRPVKDRSMLFYTVGRSYLLELYHSELQAYQGQNCRWTNDPDALMSSDGTETEIRESGIVYSCPPGQHDDLSISCAMLAWAATPSAFERLGQDRFVRAHATQAA